MRIIEWTLALILVVTLGYFGSVYATDDMRPEFTILQVENIGPLDSGKPAAQLLHTDAMRKDGARFRRSTYTANGSTCSTDALELPNERKRIAMDICVNLKSTYPVSHETAQHWMAYPPSDCSYLFSGMQYQHLGEFRMYGVKVQRFVVDDPAQTWESNPSPQLACLSVKDVHKWKDAAGNITSETVRDTFDLKTGSPDPALFTVPDRLTEAKPSEVRDAMSQLRYGSVPDKERYKAGNQRADDAYRKANKRIN